jgi:hypothetical protein
MMVVLAARLPSIFTSTKMRKILVVQLEVRQSTYGKTYRLTVGLCLPTLTSIVLFLSRLS